MSLLTLPTKLSKTATLIVAANDSKDTDADYVCTGVDDQVEINNALANLGAAGGCVYLREGTFLISASINMSSSKQSLIGTEGTIIKVANGVDAITYVIHATSSEANVSMITIDGNSGGTTGASTGIFFEGATNSTIKDCLINYMRTYGIWIKNCEKVIVTRNFIENCTDSCVYQEGTTVRTSIVGNQIWGNGDKIVIYLNNSYSIIANNVIQRGSGGGNKGGTGIYLDASAPYTVIRANIIYALGRMTNPGIYIHSDHNTIVGNLIVSSYGHSIHVDGADYNLISSNRFKNNGQEANDTYSDILLENTATYNTITGNIMTADAANKVKYHIREGAVTDDYNDIIGNVLKGAATGNVSDQGANTIEQHNIGGTP